jgi:hypothetical protein
MDLEQQLTDVLGRRAGAVPVAPGGPDDLAGVRARARSIQRRRAAGAAVGVAALVAAVVVPIGVWGNGQGQAEPPFTGQSPTASGRLSPSGPSGTPGDDPTGSPVTTGPAGSAGPVTPADCSAYGVARPERPVGLPPAVADTWQRLVDAAATCDFDALEAMGANAVTSYGDPSGAENLRRWESAGRPGDGNVGILLKVLSLSGARLDQGETAYVWPAIHGHAATSWADVTDADLAELRAIHTPEEIAQFDDGQMYYGWRVGITESGTWQYFVAGD